MLPLPIGEKNSSSTSNGWRPGVPLANQENSTLKGLASPVSCATMAVKPTQPSAGKVGSGTTTSEDQREGSGGGLPT